MRRSLRSGPLALALLTLVAGLAPRPSAAAPSGAARGPDHWEFIVTIEDLARGVAEVEWRLPGVEGPGAPLQLCSGGMAGAADAVSEVRQLEPAPLPARQDEGTWTLPADGRPRRLRYRVDLARLAREHGDPDYASRVGEDLIVSDGALLLQPDPLPERATITVEFRLPPGLSVAGPWQRLPGPGLRFQTDAAQYRAGSYLTVGKLRDLGAVPLRGGTLSLTMLARGGRATAEGLRRWVTAAAAAVADFYGGLPGGRVHVTLVPVPGSGDAGVFGAVLRRGLPSVVLYYGAEAADGAFPGEWVSFHELFHLGNPDNEQRMPWFIEGFTTYYQDVLRARSGARSEQDMWDDLYDGLAQHCAPEGGGRSLAEDSRDLRKTHRYTRVYWGGACLALLADVAIREASGGTRSLDDVMLELRRAGQRESLSEADIVAAIDKAAGRPLAKAHLRARRLPPIARTFERLGVLHQQGKGVRLREDAPLAALRRGIMSGRR